MLNRMLSIAALLILSNVACYAAKKEVQKEGYKFIVSINNANDTVLYLGQYYNRNQYAIDTAVMNKKGQFIFEDAKKKLYPGLYFFTNNKDKLVEFAVNKEPLNYKFTTDESNWTAHMKVTGSPENEKFFEYQKMRHHMNRQVDSVRKNATNLDQDMKTITRKMGLFLDSINNEYVTKYPDYVLSIMMRATKEIEVPVVDSVGDSLTHAQRYTYYCTHFFDNTALDNDMMVRTPAYVFYNKIDSYFDEYLNGASPETIIKYADMLVERSRPSQEVFKYLVLYIAEKYLKSSVMSYDAIYVHMIEKYYMSGDAFWASPTSIDEEAKRAMRWKKLLIGEPAPELILKNKQGQWHSIYQIPNKYTLLVFWAPSCGHCATVIPALYKFYDENKDKYDIGTFAVNTDIGDVEKWEKFVKDKGLHWDNYNGDSANVDWREVYDIISTPVVYLLDKDKKIIGKKLDANVLEKLFEVLEPGKNQKSEKPQETPSTN